MKRRDFDRRSQNRLKLSGKAIAQFIGPTGVTTGNAFKGELSDISSGGLSFFIRISKKETARLLLGRKLSIKFPLSIGESQVEVDKDGTILAVHACPFEDYSVHIRFDNPLDQDILNQIERCPNPTSLVDS
jgi:hypothetical protein